MFCTNCGTKLLAEGSFCHVCGEKIVGLPLQVVQNQLQQPQTIVQVPVKESQITLEKMIKDFIVRNAVLVCITTALIVAICSSVAYYKYNTTPEMLSKYDDKYMEEMEKNYRNSSWKYYRQYWAGEYSPYERTMKNVKHVSTIIFLLGLVAGGGAVCFVTDKINKENN